MRLRVRFSKLGKVRFTSHRDLARILERAIRRIDMPVAYSQGYSPRPKLHFGLALPTGASSTAEFIDIDLREDIDSYPLAGLAERLSAALPVGVEVTAVAETPRGAMSLQEAVTSSTWRVVVGRATPAQLQDGIDRLLAADELMMTRQRKGRDVIDDVRPYLHDLRVVGATDGGVELLAELGTRPRGLRPSELIALFGEQFAEGPICRTHQWMQQDGARAEPLPDDATSAPHAGLRAS